MNNRDLAVNLLTILAIFGNVGIALKFVTFQAILNSNLAAGNSLTGLFFPYFPNLLDSAFLILSSLFLGWRITTLKKELKKRDLKAIVKAASSGEFSMLSGASRAESGQRKRLRNDGRGLTAMEKVDKAFHQYFWRNGYGRKDIPSRSDHPE